VDAHIAMEGEGPAAGEPVPLGLIIAGEDAIAVDLVASAIIGWKPQEEVGTNYLAKKRGIGPASLDEVEVVGESIEAVMQVFKKPEIHQDGEMFIKIRMPIHCDESKCQRCGVCERICPARAIRVVDMPEFNMDQCIQCFCCVELCPYNALKAQRPDE
jgi:ferredoxin